MMEEAAAGAGGGLLMTEEAAAGAATGAAAGGDAEEEGTCTEAEQESFTQHIVLFLSHRLVCYWSNGLLALAAGAEPEPGRPQELRKRIDCNSNSLHKRIWLLRLRLSLARPRNY